MEYYKKYWESVDDTFDFSKAERNIKFKGKKFCINGIDYKLFTYTPYIGRYKTDDEFYSNNVLFVKYLPRSFSIVVQGSTIIGTVCGPRKFTGPDLSDDDVGPGTKNKLMETNYAKVKQWERDNELDITVTEKVNGKLAILSIMHDTVHDQTLLVGGSKNNHIIVDYNATEVVRECSLLIKIFDQIFLHKDSLTGVLHNNYCSIVGELDDGEHFTIGDNKIHWFTIIENGICKEPYKILEILRDAELPYVSFYNPEKSLDETMQESKILNHEGLVIYCTNNKINETILFKSKSTIYIVKRFLRQVLLNGTQNILNIQKRFVDAQVYHGLNTTASIRITKLFYKFASWFAKKGYPPKILGINKLEYFDVGFNNYWVKFLEECNESEISLNLSDFGSFNSDIYLNSTKYECIPLKTVIFLQGAQGSGKSTIARILSQKINSLTIEQDLCYSDSVACQGQLYHYLRDPKYEYIVIARCNINESHYKKYLEIAHRNLAKVIFVALTCNIDQLMLRVKTRTPPEILGAGNVLLGQQTVPINQGRSIILDNIKRLKIVSHSIEATKDRHSIVAEIISIIDVVPNYILPTSYNYIGLLIHDNSELVKFIESKNMTGKVWCNHMTLHFGKDDNYECFKEYDITIDKAIVSNGCIVFNVKTDLHVSSGYPHITGLLPYGIKPVSSINICKNLNDNATPLNIKLRCTLMYFK